MGHIWCDDKELENITFISFPGKMRLAKRTAKYNGTKAILFENGQVWCEAMRPNVAHVMKSVPPSVFKILGILRLIPKDKSDKLHEQALARREKQILVSDAERAKKTLDKLGIPLTKSQERHLDKVGR
jgi:hypothetical protein